MAVREYIKPGTRFGNLSFVSDLPSRKGVQRRAIFLCSCGNAFESRISHVKGGKTLSCGCHIKALTVARSTTHGAAPRGNISPEYRCWQSMKKRCENPKSKYYKDYGGRGIVICERWQTFANFLADMGQRPSASHSIDRYPDVNGNYEPGNCRWATDLEQNNNRRTTPMVEYQGRTQSISNWARELGVGYWSLRNRIVNLGWPIDKAFTTPFELGRNQFS